MKLNNAIAKYVTDHQGVNEDIGDAFECGWNAHMASENNEELTLQQIQHQLPWTVKYSRHFRANPQQHKDFAHGLVHLTKATGKIAGYVDDLDHRMESDMAFEKLEDYLADLVICAMRMANTSEHGFIDLQAAVERRLEAKNQVKLKR